MEEFNLAISNQNYNIVNIEKKADKPFQFFKS